MENAEERKKMKKIEKEEQLKKKLEQTTEEKMAADSKTVEGESAVVKAQNRSRRLRLHFQRKN